MEIGKVLEMSDSEKVKHYLSIYKTSKEAEKRTVKKGDKKRKTVSYEVVLASGLDAVIERVEKGEIQQFIFMPSQNKYLFKSGDVVQDVSSVEERLFERFFNNIPEEGIIVNTIPLGIIKA